MKPPIDGTEFGSITIAGERYEHDVLIRLHGKVRKRNRNVPRHRIPGTPYLTPDLE
jgi:hypothetical protein